MSGIGFRPPMLATLVDEPVDGDEWIFERKLDGIRLVAVRDGDSATVWTRNEIDRRADSTYVHGRSRSWLKLKCLGRQELVIGGFTDPRSSRPGLGALLLGYHDGDDLVYVGRVGTGFDDDTLVALRVALDSRRRETTPFDRGDPGGDADVHWVTPDLVCEVGFTEWTAAGRLRHPRFLGLRHDKDAADVVRERPSSVPGARDASER